MYVQNTPAPSNVRQSAQPLFFMYKPTPAAARRAWTPRGTSRHCSISIAAAPEKEPFSLEKSTFVHRHIPSRATAVLRLCFCGKSSAYY